MAPFPEPRIKLTANSDLKKLSYKPMAMKASEASEILDDRIDDFMALIQEHHNSMIHPLAVLQVKAQVR